MDFRVVTQHLRASSTSYGKVATDCVGLSRDVATAGHDAGTAIQDSGVSGALAQVIVALTGQLDVFGGSVSYASSELTSSAQDYDQVDSATQTRLSRAIPDAR